MFDNVCTLPLSADIFTQAVHPTHPVFAVGLSSGHVQTFRLPSLDASSPPAELSATTSNGSIRHEPSSDSASTPRRSSLTPSENGFGTIDTVWRTRRHKGSCRSAAYTSDGSSLLSAGTDGLIKAASTETGKVYSKIATPESNSSSDTPNPPSVIHAISSQTLLLATDAGFVYLYDLRAPSSAIAPRPQQAHRPHFSQDDSSEAITSLTPLPPSEASTSGQSRSFVSTAGSTLAVTDLRRGPIALSIDQGDILLSSICTHNAPQSAATRRNANSIEDKILVGSDGGIVTLWERGSWDDQKGRVVVHRESKSNLDIGTIDSLTNLPEEEHGAGLIAAGLGTGVIRFIQLRGKGGTVVAELPHDENGFDSVSTLDFDVGGRMVSGGGSTVKVWHRKLEQVQGQENEELDQDDVDSDDDSDDEPDDAVEPVERATKRRKKGTRTPDHLHGIRAIAGLD